MFVDGKFNDDAIVSVLYIVLPQQSVVAGHLWLLPSAESALRSPQHTAKQPKQNRATGLKNA